MADRVLPAFPEKAQGRLITRYTFSKLFAPLSAAVGLSNFNPAIATVPIKNQQGIRIVSFDIQAFCGTPDPLLTIEALGGELDGPAATLRAWPTPATMGRPLGLAVNLHISELDLTYWNDWLANGGVTPSVDLVATLEIQNGTAAAIDVGIQGSAVVEVYDFELSSVRG